MTEMKINKIPITYNKDFTYELERPILYQDETGEKETHTLVLYAPSNQLAEQKGILRQKVLAAFVEAGNSSSANKPDKEEKKKDKIEPEEILFAIAVSKHFLEIKTAFRELLKNGCLSLDGKIDKITNWHLDQIEDEELEEVMGQFIVNFIIPSWMKRLLAK